MTALGRAWLKALLLAALCGLVLAARVYDDYPPLRIKLIGSAMPPDQGSLSIDVPYAPKLAGQSGPIVVIAELQNTGAAAATINIAWNSSNIGSATLGPGSRTRVDLTLPDGVTLRGDDRIRFKGGGGWTLTYLEFANLHGQARGVVNAVILPAAARAPRVLSWPLILLIVAGVAWIASRGDALMRWKAARIAYGVVAAIVGAFFLLALLSSLVSPYKVLVAWSTFCFAIVILLVPGILRTVIDLRQVGAKRWLGSTAAFDSIVVALIAAGFFAAVMSIPLRDKYKGNYSGFLQLNKFWVERTPVLAGRDDIKKTLRLGDGMYDGQFMYLMAFDPFLSLLKDHPDQYALVVDTPPYRYTRIGYSVLTRVAAWNHPERYPQTMMWLLIASHFVACLVLGAILRHYGGHPGWALVYMFIPGFLQSLSAGLPESIAGAALLIGIWCLIRSQYAWAAVALAASLLVRETGVIFVAIATLWLWIARREWRAGFVIGLAAVPLAAWRAFVTWRLFPVYGSSTFLFTPASSSAPFVGILDLWREIQAGTYYPWHPALSTAGYVFPIVLTMALVVSLALLWKRRDALSAAAVAYALLGLTHDYPHVWAHVGNTERVTYDVFLLILVAFATLGRESRGLRTLVASFFAFTIAYTVWVSFDSPLVRLVLFTPSSWLF